MARNVHKEEVSLVKLPFEAIQEDRGLRTCNTPQLVLASTTDASYYKNDRTSLAFKFDSMTIELEKGDVVIPAPGIEISFPYQSDAVGFVIDWRQVVDGGVLQQGCYRVVVNWELDGLSGSFYYGSYNLREYSVLTAQKTVRLFVVLNDVVKRHGINYKDSGFAGTVRFNGQFGYMQPNYETENIIYTNNKREKVRIEAVRTYELKTSFLLHCMTRLIDEETLLAASQIYVTDHNFNNHRQDFYDFPVILSEDESPTFSYTDSVFASITAKFKDKVADHESKYDGNIQASTNVILSLPTVVNSTIPCANATVHNSDNSYSTTVPSGGDLGVPDSNVNVNGNLEGSVVSVETIDIEVMDGSSPVTPDAISIVGNTVTIEVPSGGMVIDADAQNFITALSLTSDNDILAVNTFVTLAKSNGIWADLDYIYPFIGGTATSHRYNLKTATQDGTFFGGVTHNANGVTFNGTNGYFDTGFATTAGNIYNRHLSQYVKTQTSSTAWIGSYDGTNVFGWRTDNETRLDFVGLNSLYSVGYLRLVRSALTCATIDSNTVGKIYSDGNLVYTNTAAINATPTTNTAFIGALNFNGTATFFQDTNVRFVTAGAKLDATKQAILNNLVRYFNAILGR